MPDAYRFASALATSRHPRRGFTLLEMSVVLVIVSVVMGSIAIMGNRWTEAERYRQTRSTMEAIDRALLVYYRAYRRLPCPGNLTYAFSNANYGLESAVPGTCSGGTPVVNTVSGNMVAGAVPADALDIPRSMMTDAWGRRIVYSVDRRITAYDGADTAANRYDVAEASAIGAIAIYLSGGATKRHTWDALYALLSAGPDGHGAYMENGTRYFSGSTNADEWENCDCNATAATPTDNVYIQSSTNPAFDDILTYKRRSQLYDIE